MVVQNKKFQVGDKVVSVKDTPQNPEGWIGYITVLAPGTGTFDFYAQAEDSVEEFAFDGHELELLPIANSFTVREQGLVHAVEIKATVGSALDKQIGGGHYKDKGIQPIQYIFANNLGFCEANIVKYASRWKDKGGIQDLEKIIHYAELLIEQAKKEGYK